MWSQLDTAFSRAADGQLLDLLPCEAYCQSLTHPRILSAGLHGRAHNGSVQLTHTALDVLPPQDRIPYTTN